ncbi:MAG: S8 family serine peptidase [Trueperaceae bacterium]|nr:S8 family serine peptidase [Trueperaceae bacterium]
MRTLVPHVRSRWLIASIAVALLAACQTTTPDPTRTTGRIAGSLLAGASPGQLVAPRAEPSQGATSASTPRPGDVVAGEVIVRFQDDAIATSGSPTTWAVDGMRLDVVRALALPGARLYRAVGLDAAATIALAERLSAHPDVRYAQPNLVMSTFQTVPNDPLYARQWHYEALRLPEAWDVTTGVAGVVVAVVDTGILHRTGDAAATHPDLVGRVLQGYDFVANPDVAGDGTPRDDDPYDEDVAGDAHGTHVAGTIGARTDDGVGVAGVDWAARLLPVRVLGLDGAGSLADVIDGTLWAAGFSVEGVPSNAHSAHVINLSLGGAAPCGAFEQEAFDRIATSSPRNAVVVVAAGNEGAPVSGTTPASCSSVLTVGATDQRDVRAAYSNYGPRIDVMAPGGDLTSDRDADGFPDGVLSLGRTATGFGYQYLQGTSMATPHVAGVVALMKALEPDLSFEEARAFLVLTALPLSAGECGTGAASDCGAGLVDAAAALAALAGGTQPTPDDGAVAFAPDPLDFGLSTAERPLTLTNVGGTEVAWEVFVYDLLPGNPGDVPEGTIYVADGNPASGTLAPGASVTTVLGIDRSFLTAEGTYQIFLVFRVDGVEQGLTVRFQNGTPPLSSPTGPTSVVAFADVRGTLVTTGGQAAGAFFPTFDFSVPADDHVVVGWTDQDDDGRVGPGDFLGTYPSWVRVAPGARVAGVDIELASVLDVEAALRAAVPWAASDAVRAALEASAAAGVRR